MKLLRIFLLLVILCYVSSTLRKSNKSKRHTLKRTKGPNDPVWKIRVNGKDETVQGSDKIEEAYLNYLADDKDLSGTYKDKDFEIDFYTGSATLRGSQGTLVRIVQGVDTFDALKRRSPDDERNMVIIDSEGINLISSALENLVIMDKAEDKIKTGSDFELMANQYLLPTNDPNLQTYVKQKISEIKTRIEKGNLVNSNVLQLTTDNAVYQYSDYELGLYRIINKLYRKADSLSIFKFRGYISALSKQLKLLPKNYQAKILYRGTLMSKEEARNVLGSAGKRISLNGFTSTSGDNSVATNFLKNSIVSQSLDRFIYQLKVPTQAYRFLTHIKPFAKHQNEDEYLIDLLAMLTIKNVSILKDIKGDEYKLLELEFSNYNKISELLNAEQKSFYTLVEAIVSEMQNQILSFAEVLLWKNDFRSVIAHLSGQTFQTNEEKAAQNFYIAFAYTRLGEYKDAYKHLDQAITANPANKRLQARIFILNGVLLCKNDYHQFGLDSFKKAISILEKENNAIDSFFKGEALLLSSLASLDLNEINQSGQYLDQVEALVKKNLGENHLFLSSFHKCKALHLKSKGNNADSLELVKKGIRIRESIYGENHFKLSQFYSLHGLLIANTNLGLSYYFLAKAVKISKQKFGFGHPETANNLQNMAYYYETSNNTRSQTLFLNAAYRSLERVYPNNSSFSYSNINNRSQNVSIPRPLLDLSSAKKIAQKLGRKVIIKKPLK